MTYPQLTLRRGHDLRFRSGHPWVFSNELAEISKARTPGEFVKLCDENQTTLAIGIIHTRSLIAFRALTRSKGDFSATPKKILRRNIQKAIQSRIRHGLTHASFRCVHGESDGLPGLIIDAYLESTPKSNPWHITVQLQSLSAEVCWEVIQDDFALLWHDLIPSTEKPVVHLKRNAEFRKLDGLDIMEPSGTQITSLRTIAHKGLHADLLGGQKTGLFLDQMHSMNHAAQMISMRFKDANEPVQIADLFSYAGAWSAAISEKLTSVQKKSIVTCIDQSSAALDLAQMNCQPHTSQFTAIRADLFTEWENFLNPTTQFHVVCLDPPGMISSKKQLSKASAAYIKLNREAMRRVATNGLLITSSCSQGVSQEDFDEILVAAARKSGRIFRMIFKGLLAPDHASLLGFPEGDYLKTRILERIE